MIFFFFLTLGGLFLAVSFTGSLWQSSWPLVKLFAVIKLLASVELLTTKISIALDTLKFKLPVPNKSVYLGRISDPSDPRACLSFCSKISEPLQWSGGWRQRHTLARATTLLSEHSVEGTVVSGLFSFPLLAGNLHPMSYGQALIGVQGSSLLGWMNIGRAFVLWLDEGRP